ncbi:terminase gpA endonuclease subunit [Desulfonatronum thiodismutans]|uniref:terminase gpA endonuclease subunit n=1 Tax=Desulfonatronum thiodismutans TaxID=159290 RepID=UPI0004ABE814|nr:terminase gpA endonuclease subunit [Desulfonatronum thiodismutans]
MDCQTNLENWWKDYWSPPALLNPWEWAEESLELSARSTPFPGRFTTVRTPFVRVPLEAFQDPVVRRVTVCFSAQSGKTTVLSVGLAYVIDQAPGPILYTLPSENAALSFSRNRLQPLIQDSPVLARHLTDRKHDFKGLEMMLDRLTINLVGAASPAQLAMRPIRYLFADEIDKWPLGTDREADALSLAIERVKSFRNHKIVLASTPTTDKGAIWQNYQAGSREEYHIVCAECGASFPLEWELIKWPQTLDLEEVRASTWLECPGCKATFTEREKVRLLQAGEWVKTNPLAPADHRSFRINELASPVSRWGDLAVKFLSARAAQKTGDLGPLHSFINSSLAQPWSEPEHMAHKRPEEIQKLCDHRSQGELPDVPLAVLTAGVDTQDNGFWVVIRAWGENMASWLVREMFVPDTDVLVETMLNSRFAHPSGQEFAVRLAFIDSSGHRTAEVYELCRRIPVFKPIKGEQKIFGGTWKNSLLDRYTGRDGKSYPIPGGLQLIRLDTTFYKNMLSAKMSLDPEGPGAMRITADVSGDYFSHMTSEYRDAKGYWQRPKHKRGDLWDCEVYNLACADFLGIRDWKATSVEPKKATVAPKQANPFTEGANPFSRTGRQLPSWFTSRGGRLW